MQIGAMQGDELVSAIAQPALRVGLRMDPDLIAQIINDMQCALKDLFDSQQQKGGVIALTLNDYLERGVQDTRRAAIFDELVPAGVQRTSIEGIVARLADARLITTDEIDGKDTVTISHEKLIDAWPWLKKLVSENRDVIALQNEIAEDAKEWPEHTREDSYLYTGARLINVREQLDRKQLVLSGTASEFVRAGFRRQQREQRARIFSIAGVVGLIIAGIAIFSYISTTNAKNLAEQSKHAENTQAALASTSQANAVAAQAASTLAVANEEKAKKQAQIARLGELAAQSVSLREKNLPISLLLGIEAFKEAHHERDLLCDRPAVRQMYNSIANWILAV